MERVSLVEMPLEHFTRPKAPSSAPSVDIDPKAFCELLGAVSPASSRDVTRETLTGVVLELLPGFKSEPPIGLFVRAVATDGYRLHLADRILPLAAGGLKEPVALTLRAVEAIRRAGFAPRAKSFVTLSIAEGKMWLKQTIRGSAGRFDEPGGMTTELSTTFVDSFNATATFYKNVFPREPRIRLTVVRKALISTIEDAPSSNEIVTLAFDGKTMQLRVACMYKLSSAFSSASAREGSEPSFEAHDLPVIAVHGHCAGPSDLVVRMNRDYLLQALEAQGFGKPSEHVVLHVPNREQDPLLVTAGGNLDAQFDVSEPAPGKTCQVIMPIRPGERAERPDSERRRAEKYQPASVTPPRAPVEISADLIPGYKGEGLLNARLTAEQIAALGYKFEEKLSRVVVTISIEPKAEPIDEPSKKAL